MQDEYFAKEWFNNTTLHPVALGALIVLSLAMLALPRRLSLLPMILMACFIAPAQRIVVMTLDFNLLRIMVLVGWLRLIVRGELQPFRWHPMDTVVAMYAVAGLLTYTALHADMDAFVYRLGSMYDSVGMYFLFRYLVRDWKDVDRAVGLFILVSIPVAVAFLIEKSTSRNAFAVFGGVPEFTRLRQGRLRCQGAFAHPILAGCFWAALMPQMGARLWRRGKVRWTAFIGLSTASIIIITCSSSTPVMAVLFGLLGAFLFPLRQSMQVLRWGLLAVLICLHLVMNNPVWHLLARIDIVGGSTGWYRYLLIDEAIEHFGEWWLLGTVSTVHWWSLGLYDIANHFLYEATQGGLVTLVLFVTMIALAFGAVGRTWRKSWPLKPRVALAWSLGCSLFLHVMNFFAVSYFGQILLVWYLQLAMIAALVGCPPPMHRRRRVPAVGSELMRPAVATATSADGPSRAREGGGAPRPA